MFSSLTSYSTIDWYIRPHPLVFLHERPYIRCQDIFLDIVPDPRDWCVYTNTCIDLFTTLTYYLYFQLLLYSTGTVVSGSFWFEVWKSQQVAIFGPRNLYILRSIFVRFLYVFKCFCTFLYVYILYFQVFSKYYGTKTLIKWWKWWFYVLN